MKLIDYHTHHDRCGHASGTMEEYILEAIGKNLAEIGITDHFPLNVLPIPPKYQKMISTVSMSKDEFSTYISEIAQFREKFKEKIKVKISTEVGFNSPDKALNLQKQLLEPHMDEIDYILGGIHSVKMEDDSIITLTILDKTESVDLEDLTYRYLRQMERLVSCGYFDVIAHFDNNRFQFLPDEIIYSEKNWQYLLTILDNIKNKGMVIEVNTSGHWKGVFRQFPNDDIIEEIILREIPLTLGSDAHRPQQVGYRFDKFVEKAKKMGMEYLCSFDHREQSKIKI